jgi:hypothetical protein
MPATGQRKTTSASQILLRFGPLSSRCATAPPCKTSMNMFIAPSRRLASSRSAPVSGRLGRRWRVPDYIYLKSMTDKIIILLLIKAIIELS